MPDISIAALLYGFDVDRTSEVPIYKQVDSALRRLIRDGRLARGQKLPSTRDLAVELGVSRITVKSVYEQLVAEGYAHARTGAGTFVAEGLDFADFPQVSAKPANSKPPELPLSAKSQEIVASQASARHGETAAFRPGVPALDLFPVKLWNKYLTDAGNADRRRHLSYGHVNGSPALRQAIAQHLTEARGVVVNPEEVVITSGAQQAFVLIAFILLKAGDTVWYENPGHIAGRDVMSLFGANVKPVPIDAEGMDLKFARQTYADPALIFTTPSHQQPLGTTMSLVRRLALLNFAKQSGAWVIEDDYDSEFRYRGRPLPALSALDQERRVFYVGTFSKSMFAAMRLGYVVVPPALVDSFAKARNLLGQSSSPVVEEALAQFMRDGRFAEHIRKMRRVYRDRRDALMDCLHQRCKGLLQPQETDAGMHLLTRLPDGVSDQSAHERLLQAGIESLPLSVYCQTPLDRQALVLGFTGTPEKQMDRLVRRMADALNAL